MELAFLLLLGAQEVVLVEDDPELGRFGFAASLQGRMSFLSGDLSPGEVDYADNFDTGYGLGIELDLLRGVAPGAQVGGYLSAGWDRYGGDRFEDPFLTSADPDALEVLTLLAGVKSSIWAGPGVRLEGRLGAGAAHYGDVDAFIVDEGVPLGELEFFEASWRPAFELAGRVGFGAPEILFTLGVGFRLQGGPEEADDSDFLLDTDEIWLFTLDAGLLLRF